MQLPVFVAFCLVLLWWCLKEHGDADIDHNSSIVVQANWSDSFDEGESPASASLEQDTTREELTPSTHRHLFVDPIVKRRYLEVSSGFRQHPSYYSESYLPRGQLHADSKIKALTKQWGSWTFVDAERGKRPQNDFYERYPNRDVPFKDFPASAWQKDQAYLGKWLKQAIALTNRTLEAILWEYGYGLDRFPGKSFSDRAAQFRLTKTGPPTSPQKKIGGWMNQQSYNGLKRRLLHAIMTEDRFNIAMGGHSAAAGHGNNFQQSYTLQIAKVLEPVFARLGVKMTARNMGMGGLGTLQNGMAASSIYGNDVDILLWDSSMTERNAPPIGVFAIQGLLSDRAPLLWFWQEKGVLQKLHTLTGADIAVYGNNGQPAPVSTVEDMMKRPYATRWMSCKGSLIAKCKQEQYSGKCWVERKKFKWEGIDVDGFSASDIPMEGRQSWHPGWRQHQKIGRGFAFAILLALKEVLTMWERIPKFKIADKDWHVSEHYNSIHSKVFSNRGSFTGWCKGSSISANFCKFQAQGATENAARTRPWATSLRALMVGMPSTGLNPVKNPYDPPDVRMPWLDPPKSEIDVLAIAENGIPFEKNMARIADSAIDMRGPKFRGNGDIAARNPDITPGKGWSGGFAGSDNCDGAYDSFCDRAQKCRLYSHNDHRNGLLFDGFSGWGIFNLPNVRRGTIVIKLHSWFFGKAPRTAGWCSENNKQACKGRMLSTSNNGNATSPVHDRRLKPKPPPYCSKFKFDFAIDGKITTWDLGTWQSKRKQNERVVETWTLLDEPTYSNGKPKNVELAFRVRGCGRAKAFELTHIYWI